MIRAISLHFVVSRGDLGVCERVEAWF